MILIFYTHTHTQVPYSQDLSMPIRNVHIVVPRGCNKTGTACDTPDLGVPHYPWGLPHRHRAPSAIDVFLCHLSSSVICLPLSSATSTRASHTSDGFHTNDWALGFVPDHTITGGSVKESR